MGNDTREAAVYSIPKENLEKLFEVESEHFRVYAPVRMKDGVELERLKPGVAPYLGSSLPTMSPKSVVFPRTETLYEFDYDTISTIDSDGPGAVPDTENQVLLFGIKPCDAAAFSLLDYVFGPENHGYHDPYYEARRRAMTIVTLACNAPCTTCFCTSIGGDPGSRRGADIVAYDLENRLLLESVTEKGVSELDRMSDYLSPARPEDVEHANAAIDRARGSIRKVTYDRDATRANLDAGFGASAWEAITNSCIGCGACTYVCPTCHCFDIADEERHYKGRRIRVWDSCQFPNFTKHASGHNPRPSKNERLRQRFMHKFSYAPVTVDEVYCVGCGRCIRSCPVNLDIREVLEEFAST